MNVKIEKDIPFPDRNSNLFVVMQNMEVGDSFLVESNKRGTIGNYMRTLAGIGKLFKTRAVDDKNHRVWRLK